MMIQQRTDTYPDDREHVRGVMKGKDAEYRPTVMQRKIICRYGRGCTHMNDPTHRERFWHPPVPPLSADQLRTHYICNECGIATTSLPDLQLHLKLKTAWSNKSLVGCRISCLLDFKEWHEGYVTQFHKSGKHCVEFRAICEKRWLNMRKMAFYIVERPAYASSFAEYKEDDVFTNINGTAVEDTWVYAEDISIDYAFAQSVLFKVYGSTVQETGHKTKGHVCVTDSDRDNAKNNKGSLLYGELLPRGANKAFGMRHLHCSDAKVLFDLGMGAGKVAVQAFVQFRNLEYVYGVELSAGRYCLAEDAVLRMVLLLGAELFTVEVVPGQSIRVTERLPPSAGKENEGMGMGANDLTSALGALGQVVVASSQGLANLITATSPRTESKSEYDPHVNDGSSNGMNNNPTPTNASRANPRGRVLHLVCGNMFDTKNIAIADIVMLETDIPADNLPDLNELLAGMKEGSRTLTYLDLRKIWTTSANSSATAFPFRQLEHNKHLSDRFPTSWSVQRGHHFFLWCKHFAGNHQGNGSGKLLSANSAAANGVDDDTQLYGFRSSSSHGFAGNYTSTSSHVLSGVPDNSLTLRQLEDELWRRHASTGPSATSGRGIHSPAGLYSPNNPNPQSNGQLHNRQSNQGYASPPPPSNQNTNRCLPIGFSFRSLLFGDRSNGSREGSSVSMTRKKDGNGGGRRGDRDDSSASGSSSSPRTARGSHDNTNGAATTTFVDRDRVIPLNADGTRSRGTPDPPQPYALLSRAATMNSNTNITSNGGNVGGMQGSNRCDKDGNIIVPSTENISSTPQHTHNHPHHPINQMSPTNQTSPSSQPMQSLLPLPPFDPTATTTVDHGSNGNNGTNNGHNSSGRHNHNHNNNNSQGRKPSSQPEETAGWYSLGYAIERLAFPLTSTANEQPSNGIVHLNRSHSNTISVQQVHVDDADESSDDDQDFDADGDGTPSPMDLNQLHNHSHSPGLFLDHSLSHPLTLGLGGVWTNPLASSSSSSTTQLRQQRTVTTSPRRDHDIGGMGQLDLEDALSPRSEEGMVQALAMSSPSGRQNNNYSVGGGGGNGGLQPFSVGGNFYAGPGMSSPHVASSSQQHQQQQQQQQQHQQQHQRGTNVPTNPSTSAGDVAYGANRQINNYNTHSTNNNSNSNVANVRHGQHPSMKEDIENVNNNSTDQSGCVIS